MTEAAWLACTDPTLMLNYLRGKVSDRKLRLFAVACCRRVWDLLHKRARKLLITIEAFAEKNVGWDSLERARAKFFRNTYYLYIPICESDTAENAARSAASAVLTASAQGLDAVGCWRSVVEAQLYLNEAQYSDTLVGEVVGILRDLFGTLFRTSPQLPAAVLAWNDATVRHIAEGIYEERAFDRLPILADALLDSGCDNEDLIQHCRSAGPHVRGCWVIDLILGKS